MLLETHMTGWKRYQNNAMGRAIAGNVDIPR